MRFDRLIARNLGFTRSGVTRLLRQGRIANAEGTPIRDPRWTVPGLPLEIQVDGQAVLLCDERHVLQHKPIGVVTATDHPEHPTAYALLESEPLHGELRAVGRLDLDCSGLLLWTTDGKLIQRLTHPKHAVPRTYHVELARAWAPVPDNLELEDGHRPQVVALERLDPEQAHPALVRSPEAEHLASITLTSGKYHEVKRIFAALGSHVVALCRVRHGDIELPRDLPAGEAVPIDLPALVGLGS